MTVVNLGLFVAFCSICCQFGNLTCQFGSIEEVDEITFIFYNDFYESIFK